MTAHVFGALVAATVICAAAGASAGRREHLQWRIGSFPRPHARRWAAHSFASRWIESRRSALGWRGSAAGFTAAFLGSPAVVAALGALVLGRVGAVVGAIGAPAILAGVVRSRARRERSRGEAQLREYVLALAASVRAGLSIRRALAEAATDIEAPLRPSLEAALRALEVGEPVDVALERLAAVASERDARLLAALLSMHVRSGGDLPALLDDVAGIVGHRIESRRSLRALTAQGRASGVVLAVLPVAFVALLSWTGGDGLGAFYETPLGVGMLLAGLGCEAAGFLWIRRIVEAPARDG